MRKACTKLTLIIFAVAIVGLSAPISFAGPAQITIVNVNAPNVGFNDPAPAAPVGGNPGTTLGQQRLIAFQHAADIWGARLDSSVEIRIRAQFVPLGAGVLGSAGPVSVARNFPGALLPNTWYHIALASNLPVSILLPRWTTSPPVSAAPSTFTWDWTTIMVHNRISWPCCCTSLPTDSGSANSQTLTLARCSRMVQTLTTPTCLIRLSVLRGRR